MKTRVSEAMLLAFTALLATLPAAAFASMAPVSSVSPNTERVVSTPRIPLRFEPCLPVTCGSSGDWSYTGIGGRYRVLVGTRKIAFIQSGAKGERPRITTLEFVGATADSNAIAGNRLGSEASYFSGNDPKQWHSHVPDYDSVTLHGIYAGIDLRFYESELQLEFDIQAQPGADLTQFRLHATDDDVRVLDNGDLKLGEGEAAFSIHIPAAYQIDAGNRRLPVTAGFSVNNMDEIALRTGELQKSLPTVVDPTVEFSTYLEPQAGSSPDSVYVENVSVDASGNIWVAGSTYGPFPDLSKNPELNCPTCASLGYTAVAFAAKFDPTGSLLVTVALGETTDNQVGMTLDEAGNVYLDGDVEAGTNFPTTPGAYDAINSGFSGFKIFVSKIDSAGSTLVFSTLLGGSSGFTRVAPELGVTGASGSIQVDALGDVFVGGQSSAVDFPVTKNAVQKDCGAGVCDGGYANGILAEFSPAGSKLLYGTYLGGSGTAYCTYYSCKNGGYISQLALESGKVVVTGNTFTSNFPVWSNALHRTLSECVDYPNLGSYGLPQAGFLASIDLAKSGLQALTFSTYICETAASIAVGPNNNIYLGVAANAENINMPATPGAFTPIYNYQVGAYGAGVEEISADGSQVLRMAWLGLVYAQLDAMTLDSEGNVYLIGGEWIDSTGIPIVNAVQTSLGTASVCNTMTWQSTGCAGSFLIKFDPQLDAPVFATVYGPTGGSLTGSAPQGSIAVDKSGNIYAGGSVVVPGWPTTPGSFQPKYQSGQEGFLLKITDIPANPDVLLTTDHLFFGQVTFGSPVTETVTIVNHSSSSLQVKSISSGGRTDPMSAAQNCVGSIAVNTSCSIAVTFNPTAAGDLTGAITIIDSSSTSPHIITGIGEGLTGVSTAAPAFSNSGGRYAIPQTVKMTDATSGAKIYYTIDGTAPTTASTEYKNAITVGITETIEAIAEAPGYTLSPLATAAFTIQPILQSVSISGTTALGLGQSETLAAMANYSEGSPTNVTSDSTWTSSDTAVATVSQAGSLKAVSAGTATISASYLGFTGATRATVVTKLPTSLSVFPQGLTMYLNAQQQFSALGTYSDGSVTDLSNIVSWHSSATEKASVLPSGLLTGTSAGNAKVTASIGTITSSTGLTILSEDSGFTYVDDFTDSRLFLYHTSDGSDLTFLGERDAKGKPTFVNGYRVVNSDGTWQAYTLDSLGRPILGTLSDNAKFQFNWTAPKSAVLTGIAGNRSSAESISLAMGSSGTTTGGDSRSNIANPSMNDDTSNSSVVKVFVSSCGGEPEGDATVYVTPVSAFGGTPIPAQYTGNGYYTAKLGTGPTNDVFDTNIPIYNTLDAICDNLGISGLNPVPLELTAVQCIAFIESPPLAVGCLALGTGLAAVNAGCITRSSMKAANSLHASTINYFNSLDINLNVSESWNGQNYQETTPPLPAKGPFPEFSHDFECDKVATVKVAPAVTVIDTNQTAPLTAEAFDSEKKVLTSTTFKWNWTSDKPDIAEVPSTGIAVPGGAPFALLTGVANVTGKAVGTTTITAKDPRSGKFGASNVSVNLVGIWAGTSIWIPPAGPQTPYPISFNLTLNADHSVSGRMSYYSTNKVTGTWAGADSSSATIDLKGDVYGGPDKVTGTLTEGGTVFSGQWEIVNNGSGSSSVANFTATSSSSPAD